MYVIILHKKNGDSDGYSYTFLEAQRKLESYKALGYVVKGSGRIFDVWETDRLTGEFYARDLETGEWEQI